MRSRETLMKRSRYAADIPFLLPKTQFPPTRSDFSKQSKAIPRSRRALIAAIPEEPAPMTQTLGRSPPAPLPLRAASLIDVQRRERRHGASRSLLALVLSLARRWLDVLGLARPRLERDGLDDAHGIATAKLPAGEHHVDAHDERETVALSGETLELCAVEMQLDREGTGVHVALERVGEVHELPAALAPGGGLALGGGPASSRDVALDGSLVRAADRRRGDDAAGVADSPAGGILLLVQEFGELFGDLLHLLQDQLGLLLVGGAGGVVLGVAFG